MACFANWGVSTIKNGLFCPLGRFSVCVCVLVTRPLRGLAVKALRGMPPTLPGPDPHLNFDSTADGSKTLFG